MDTRTNEIIDQNVDYKAECSRLKRERDDARKIIAATLSILPCGHIPSHTPESMPERIRELVESWVAVERERDEAREEVAHWKTEYEIVVARLCGNKHPRDNGIISEHEIIPKLTQERDEARNKMADALQEVDLRTLDFERMNQECYELRKELKEYRSIAENIGAVKAVSEKEKAIRERDEAREKYATEATEHMLAINKICNESKKAKEELANIESLMFGGLVQFSPKDGLAWRVFDAVMELKKERDEAREALRRIVDLGKTMPEEAEEVRIARETLEAAK